MASVAKRSKGIRKMMVAMMVEETEKENKDEGLVAVVGMSSSVIGNGMGSESDEYMSLLPQKHLWLNCFVNVPSTYETHLNALGDNACAPVLIRQDFTDELQLQQFTLWDPVKVNLAVDSGKVKKFEFGECVKLRLYSIDHSWKSKKNSHCCCAASLHKTHFRFIFPHLSLNHD